MNRRDDFIYDGKAWRAEAESFDAGGSVGIAVLARRLSWDHVAGFAYTYGETRAVPLSPGVRVHNFEDGSIFNPEDPDGDEFGLFDREREEQGDSP
jgi:hypothetical protein